MWIPLLVLAVIWLVLSPLRFFFKAKGHKLVSIGFKGLATLLCALMAGRGYVATGDAYAKWIFAGLCVCTLADVMLDLRFEVGGALFFLGHMLYVLALAQFRALSWWSLTVAVIALAGLWLFASRYKNAVPQWHIMAGIFIYGLALAALLGFSLPLPFLAPSRRALLAALGAAAFVLSDMTLCHNTVRKKPVKWHYISLGIYYTAQWLLALSAK